jgi:transposase
LIADTKGNASATRASENAVRSARTNLIAPSKDRKAADHKSGGPRYLLQDFLTHRLGHTLLLTNHRDWTAEQVVAAYASQQELEQVFRGLKEGDWLNWQPLHRWTDSKIRVHAFHCLLGLSLLYYVLRQAQAFWPQLTVEKLQEELEQVQQFVLLYPALRGGPRRTATILATQSLVQRGLVDTLGLQELV